VKDSLKDESDRPLHAQGGKLFTVDGAVKFLPRIDWSEKASWRAGAESTDFLSLKLGAARTLDALRMTGGTTNDANDKD